MSPRGLSDWHIDSLPMIDDTFALPSILISSCRRHALLERLDLYPKVGIDHQSLTRRGPGMPWEIPPKSLSWEMHGMVLRGYVPVEFEIYPWHQRHCTGRGRQVMHSAASLTVRDQHPASHKAVFSARSPAQAYPREVPRSIRGSGRVF